MNKKSLSLILTALTLVVLPGVLLAQGDPSQIASKISDSFQQIGLYIIVIGWVIAGILYLISAGSPEKTGTAKKAVIAAVIGTAVIILADQAFDIISGYIV
ncbi:MAG: TrbC/VirB2 family protein [Candidatus Staskawiczbacteria bacterium]|jgi:uncharacterized BrkB/YihY/UPF0761 family membrane protein